MVTHPGKKISNKKPKNQNTTLCFAYDDDLDQIYSFYCARYENIRYKEFLELGINELFKKIGSIPESEPLYTIIKARKINLGKIKDKEEKKYWQELKQLHEIPSIFLPKKELDRNMEKKIGEGKNVG